MEKFYLRIRNLLPTKKEIKNAVSGFSKREHFFFLVLIFILCASTLAMLWNINKHFMVSVPRIGGSITEGVVGTPRFVNPVLANSSTDQDLVSLVYSGLMRENPDGTLVPDLASKYEVSENGLVYTFTLKDKIYFHDGKPVTPDDVIFTVNTIKDPVMKSVKKGNWDGISVEKIDEKTLKFNLKQPYVSFLDNTTLGIMPKYLWDASPIELNETNTKPIGSGPYKIKEVGKQSVGLIDYYKLESFEKFILGRPYVENITLRFYLNEEDATKALEAEEIDQISSLSPLNALSLAEKSYRVESATLPRIFGLFFNQNQNQIFTDKNVITAIDLAIDKEAIVEKVLAGYGVVIDGPIPPNMFKRQKPMEETELLSGEKIKEAEEILKKSGWEKGPDGFLQKTTTDKQKKKTTIPFEFSISTGNASELAESAELIKKYLEAIGMKVSIKTFETGNLNQGVIRPRKYDALFFGQVINRESDLFAFWHSSQRKDPGLNVAVYTNAKVDKILEDAFITTDEKTRTQKYTDFENEIKKDMPAVFLYSPKFIYVLSKDIRDFSMNHVTAPADRFLNIHSWYLKTDNIWKVFSK